MACLLTILGYSVNDTIVIFDRVRGDQARPAHPFPTLPRINHTLSRTLLTSFTTLATGALFLFGGGAVNDFALCMIIGRGGVYSAIFIATPSAGWAQGRRPAGSSK